MDFFSARLLLIVLVDDKRPKKTNLYDEIIVLFRARNLTHALKKAIEIGRSHETEYLNGDGQKVRWALVEIVNLDCIGRDMNGTEVASDLHWRRTKQPIRFGQRFRPEKKKPSHSI